jgi:hypothetical protein
MLLLTRNELLQPHDVIPLEAATFLPTQRTQVAMMLKQLCFRLPGEILSAFPAFHEEQKNLRRD